MKIEYSFTNIENSLLMAFNILNHPRRIGSDKHIYGRLLSKVQNSNIILFTDGGRLSSESKVYSSNERINLNSNELYNETAFRWDHLFYTFSLGFNDSGYPMLAKLTNIINGEIIKCESFDEMMESVENYCYKFNLNRANLGLIIGNKKHMVSIVIDSKCFVNWKRVIPADDSGYRERWPLPDENTYNINSKSLSKRKAHPIYNLGNSDVNFEHFNIKRGDYDEYDIFEDENSELFKIFFIDDKKRYRELYIQQNIFAVLKFCKVNNTKKIKLIVLPFNYKEFFYILNNFEKVNFLKLESYK
jgi:hypothetical protein